LCLLGGGEGESEALDEDEEEVEEEEEEDPLLLGLLLRLLAMCPILHTHACHINLHFNLTVESC